MEDQSQSTFNATTDDYRPSRNQRRGERHMTLFRVGALLVESQRSLCVVRNISCGGASLRTYCELDKGQMVTLELKVQQPIEARVTWIEGADTGIAFAQSIDVLNLLKVERDGLRPRMPRIEVRALGNIRQGTMVHGLAVDNISQGGIKARCGAELAVGDAVTVMLDGLAPIDSVVHWACSGDYGIAFNAVLGLPLLVEWLRSGSGSGPGPGLGSSSGSSQAVLDPKRMSRIASPILDHLLLRWS